MPFSYGKVEQRNSLQPALRRNSTQPGGGWQLWLHYQRKMFSFPFGCWEFKFLSCDIYPSAGAWRHRQGGRSQVEAQHGLHLGDCQDKRGLPPRPSPQSAWGLPPSISWFYCLVHEHADFFYCCCPIWGQSRVFMPPSQQSPQLWWSGIGQNSW